MRFIGLFILIFISSHLNAQPTALFEGDEIISITLSGDLKELLNDRTGESLFRTITLSYMGADSTLVSLPIRSRTRGNFRRAKGNCSHPPLLLNFSKKNREGTIFKQQDRMKLVLPCRGDKYVLREYYVYKLYNMISPKSFRAQLVKLILDSPELKARDKGPFFGILLEEEDQMAERNYQISVKKQLVKPEQTEREDFLNMAVFQYMIGNTDWSVQYRQNIKLIASDSSSRPITVPYDFDHAGIVRAPYAKPAEELKMRSTLERRYRGFCMEDMKSFVNVFDHFSGLKEAIFSLYRNSERLDKKYIHSTLRYLDDFYTTINDSRRARRAFLYPCQASGTGNVVIKGLRN
ncbi:hypothetical protein [Cyclobacterium jeungdonense]|uniref:Uncharacterized protein n=1 Tax=Cyclobacterium jeungdonense TaxID=708087 RepID=A0ABT8CCL2_9BACT|nr:hypothetical protein [Cyclobacterium jeungdonense]MDN3690126.1 hypothetical protein [Cyclobacterium jeungdonense]